MRHSWNRAKIVEAMQRYAELTGVPPAATRMDRDCKHLDWLPASPTVRRHFGTWNAAMVASGFETRKVGWPKRLEH